jgi:hypothetical protein
MRPENEISWYGSSALLYFMEKVDDANLDAEDTASPYDSFDCGSEAILRFYRSRGFELRRFVTAEGGLGNNQFLFAKQ